MKEEDCIDIPNHNLLEPCDREQKRIELRNDLQKKFGQVWDTAQLQEDFEVSGFGSGLCVVRRKSDGALGSLEFTHMPRFYYNFILHEA